MVILSCPQDQICDDANTLKEQVKNTSYIIMGKYTYLEISLKISYPSKNSKGHGDLVLFTNPNL